MRFATLFTGDPAPWFRQRCTTPQGDYTFDMTGGRYVVLYLFATSSVQPTQEALQTILRGRRVFDDKRASFFGVSADGQDEAGGRLRAELPGIRHFFDADGLVGRLYGSRSLDDPEDPGRGLWYIIDPALRVRDVLADEPGAAGKVLAAIERLPSLDDRKADAPVPVLMLPHIFEADFCRRLIEYFDRSDTELSGVFTQHASGPSQTVTDVNCKRRRDCRVTDRQLVEQIQARIIRRVVPEIRKVHHFEASHMERLILASYDSRDRGCFGAHRDNTVQATEHRRFAVSINLNQDFEGGHIVFPEFSRRGYRPDAGGAIIFSCSLMHMVAPVTAGRRIACLPFVYDEQAAGLKRRNIAIARGSMTAG